MPSAHIIASPGVTRILISLSLIFFNAYMLVLALFPWPPQIFIRWFIATLALIAIVWLLAWMAPFFKIPGEGYAYLLSGTIGVMALLAYEIAIPDFTYIKVRTAFAMLAGIILAYGAYLAVITERHHLAVLTPHAPGVKT